MTKAKAQPEQPQVEAPKKRSPLADFVYHQSNALEETGKALVSLLPKEFRMHTGKALDEGKAGFNVLFDGMIDGVERGLDRLRHAPRPAEDEATKGKIKVDVE